MNRRPRPASGGAQGRPGTHVARKRFGQHFLTDEFVIGSIVDAIDPQPGDALVEIGPGLGALTNPVVARSGKLTVIELDRDIARELRLREELSVVESDVLKVDFSSLPQAAPRTLRVIGNLPYNISTPILFHLLDHVAVVQDQHFMLQKEVVDRLVAEPGGKEYGRLSVMLQAHYAMEPVCDVPPESFDPPPKVDSAVVRMVPAPGRLSGPVAQRMLQELVTAAFSQRRKILRHTLGPWLQQHGVGAGFDLTRRAEEIPVDAYLALAEEAAAKPA
jgi:16S rRNA (adenine1518-N6/adenine1519-N6)-dimethyltransferase